MGDVNAKVWTDAEVSTLKLLASEKLSLQQIAEHLGRSRRAVAHKTSQLKLCLKTGRRVSGTIQSDPLVLRQNLWRDRVLPLFVDAGSGCWEWSKKTPRGYGYICLGYKVLLVHRLALEVKLGRILKTDEHSCHRCDNPGCCNPDHLFLGNAKLNVADMMAKCRGGGQWQKGHKLPPEHATIGERNGRSKVTEAIVREIRERHAAGGISVRHLGRIYGLSGTSTSMIVKRVHWAHVK